MTSSEIRNTFLSFFKSKGHVIVPSAPMVNKTDPNLMFTNAGMNQFKDIFLGNKPIVNPRVADSQKCLRVSGKHNDLEQVGIDTYHHTMFEMLGNWSFGDYFKEDAITYAWELLTEVFNIDKDRLYVTVFEGDEKDGLSADYEAKDSWLRYVAPERIIFGNKKDNFWEMGDQGPCGPCSEIHVDIRDEEDRRKIPGESLINKDNPLVIEIWNLVFIQFNRKADGRLETLSHKHIDTGMGFERLCMILQGVKSNYDTDVFQPLIKFIAESSGIKYGSGEKTDIAMRVVADHIRAVAFAITDGQLPSNTGAGYVIRRILRRAVRYAYSFLNLKEPFLFELLDILCDQMGEAYPELLQQKSFCKKVIFEEEIAFLRTLETGIQKFQSYINANPNSNIIDGNFAFELFDTFGFPIDLTALIAAETNRTVDMNGFNKKLEEQKERSRKAASQTLSDWVYVDENAGMDNDRTLTFCGYDELDIDIDILKHRTVTTKDGTFYHLVFPMTPFYAESGGQVGDRGIIVNEKESIKIINTIKENDLSIHIAETMPQYLHIPYRAIVDIEHRKAVMANHSATHLLHKALRTIFGEHVEQKGSYVGADYLRFDFSHFQKLTDDEIVAVEEYVNAYIRDNIRRDELREIPINEAKKKGAMALFGEKYGDKVRVITFGDSVELCGGTHVEATGSIGVFKIIAESAIAAGIRRIEAITAKAAFEYLNQQTHTVQNIKNLLKSKEAYKGVENLLEQNSNLRKEIETLKQEKLSVIKQNLQSKIKNIKGINVIAEKVEIDSTAIKDLAFELKQNKENFAVILGSNLNGKAAICIVFTDDLVKKGFHAGNIIREAVKEIDGGGGGQAHFATAGGKSPEKIDKAIAKAMELVEK
ncbi:MAG: alanine--tRNA ligase [Bacteroidales bacterium]|jgi:alanyl-tRNA synthetase|nr:alanine--tRNA ligase [Bacteroidales bacterium]